MKRYFLFLLLALLPMLANAYDAEIDGIYYNFSRNNATVTYGNSSYNSYSGTVVIPEFVTYNGNTYSVTSIGNYAFEDCRGLTSVTIPNSVTGIGDYAFYHCRGLTSITIPNSVTSIGEYAFYDCRGLVSVTLKSNAIVSLDRSSSSSLEDIFGFQVKEYVIGDSVTTIGDYAFYGCSSLTSITIPNSVTSIGSSAFSGCSGLTSVTIGNSVTSIGDYAFDGCSGLVSVTLKSNAIVSLDRSSSPSLKSIFGAQVKEYVIGDSVTSIGKYAFYDCSSLPSITIPNSVTSIDYYAFSRCSGLTSITIPNSVTYIGPSAFAFCSGLTSVTIGNSVTSIGKYAFDGCRGLTYVTIPNSVTSIGDYAFFGCSGLVSVTLKSNAIVSLDRRYYSSLGSIFGAQVKEYVIGDSVTTIGNYAFEDCSSLTSITIPNSVTSIGKYAFYGCSGLTNLISKATTPPLCGSQALEDINKWECTLSVPRGYIAAYQQADQWKDFFFMEEKSFEDAIVDVKADDVEETGYYDLQGRKQSAPQKGFNIIRYSDGTSKKVFVK